MNVVVLAIIIVSYCKAKKKIIVVLPSSGISEKVGSVGRKIIFF